jgi:hypothetical protein
MGIRGRRSVAGIESVVMALTLDPSARRGQWRCAAS